jgi:hypothetical protein
LSRSRQGFEQGLAEGSYLREKMLSPDRKTSEREQAGLPGERRVTDEASMVHLAYWGTST